MKEALTSEPVLQLVITSKLHRIKTDAADYLMVAALLQEVNGYWHFVAYKSRKPTAAEQRSLIYALRTCKHYVLGNAFTAYTDYKRLEYFATM